MVDADILLLNRSFWPDTEATGQFLTGLCLGLAERFRVVAIAGSSYYAQNGNFRPLSLYRREGFKGIDIFRVRHTKFRKDSLTGRVVNWLTYSLAVFMVALRLKPKIIIVCTDPPFLGIVSVLLSRLKSAVYIYNCRDLYPDVAYGLGKLGRLNPLGRIFERLNTKAFHLARAVVCLGPSMKDRIAAKGIAAEKVRIIPDWADTARIKPVIKDANPLLGKYGLKDKFVLMYSGNLGLAQEFDSVLQGMTMLCRAAALRLVFVGQGVSRHGIMAKAASLGLGNVLFYPHQSRDLLSFSLSMADIHLVLLKKGLSGAVVPSKVYGIMAVARPYLAVADEESEPVRLIKEFGCGLWAEPGDAEGIARAIAWSMGHQDELGQMGKRARVAVEARFSKDKVMAEWFNLLAASLCR